MGGGLLGLEAANGLKLRGMDVTVVHVMPWLMERQLDRMAADLLQKSLEAKRLAFRLEAKTKALLPGSDDLARPRVAGVHLASGEILPADLVVMAGGIRPNVELAKAAGLHCDRGGRARRGIGDSRVRDARSDPQRRAVPRELEVTMAYRAAFRKRAHRALPVNGANTCARVEFLVGHQRFQG